MPGRRHLGRVRVRVAGGGATWVGLGLGLPGRRHLGRARVRVAGEAPPG